MELRFAGAQGLRVSLLRRGDYALRYTTVRKPGDRRAQAAVFMSPCWLMKEQGSLTGLMSRTL